MTVAQDVPTTRPGRVLQPDLNGSYRRLVSGKGVEVTDDRGRTLLDAAAGVGVLSLGYDVPEIVDAMNEQARRLPFVHALRFGVDSAQDLAEELAAAAPDSITRFFLCSGGSEAVESALKIARQYHVERGEPARFKFIGRWQSFHGNTLATQAVGGHLARRRRHLPLLMEFPKIESPDCYRCSETDHARCGERYAEMLRTAIERAGPETVAAFVMETVTGATTASHVPPPGYLSRIRKICDEYGILLILDEVFTAIGRTGSNFAFEQWDVLPDIVVMGKAIAAGFGPIGVVGIQDRIVAAFEDGSGRVEHNFTFASHPVVCAGAAVAVRLVRERKLVTRAREVGEVLMRELQKLEGLASIGDIRGRGLMIGVEFVSDRVSKAAHEPQVHFAQRIADSCYELGLIVYPGSGTMDGLRGDHLLLCPPLVLTDDDARRIAAIIGKAALKVEAEVGKTGT
jgi:adenosylmethionine-8-amino-7-oxononanoate aminotransferase